MPAQIAIIHGWSDSSKSFVHLRDFLVANGYGARDVWLADYISMNDDVRVEDAAKRMHDVVTSLIAAGQLAVPFDMIVHSTGGLLAREWLATFYPDGTGCPVKRLVMIAPANFGSALASLGKSMLGRVLKGWNNWFQTGTQMLQALELASPYQWQLARRDLLDPSGSGTGPYGKGKVWPFVIIGTHGYDDQMRRIVNENGSDGTVRAAAANMNAVGLTVDFSRDAANPDIRPWAPRAGDTKFPFVVLPDRDHGTIVDPNLKTVAVPATSAMLGQHILEALRCADDAAYAALATAWHDISEQTASLAANAAQLSAMFPGGAPDPGALHQYFQMVAMVRDDEGQPIDDYFLEFFAPGTTGTDDIVYFQKEVLKNVHVNGATGSMRCFFIDRNTLIDGYYGRITDPAKRQLAVSMSAAPIGSDVRYFDATREGAKGQVIIHKTDMDADETLQGARLIRNSTHLVEIVIPRRPMDQVFKLSR